MYKNNTYTNIHPNERTIGIIVIHLEDGHVSMHDPKCIT